MSPSSYLKKSYQKCKIKKRYYTHGEALYDACRLRQRFPKTHYHADAYQCPICYYWHVGRKPLKPQPTREDEALRIAIGDRAYYCGWEENHWKIELRYRYLAKITAKALGLNKWEHINGRRHEEDQ